MHAISFALESQSAQNNIIILLSGQHCKSLHFNSAAIYLGLTPEKLADLLQAGEIAYSEPTVGERYIKVEDMENWKLGKSSNPIYIDVAVDTPTELVHESYLPPVSEAKKFGRRESIKKEKFMKAYRNLLGSGISSAEAIKTLAPNHKTYGICMSNVDYAPSCYESVKSSMNRIIRETKSDFEK